MNVQKEFIKIYTSDPETAYDYIFKTSIPYDPSKGGDVLRPKGRELQIAAHENIEKLLNELNVKYICLPLNPEEDPVSFILEKIKK